MLAYRITLFRANLYAECFVLVSIFTFYIFTFTYKKQRGQFVIYRQGCLRLNLFVEQAKENLY